MEYFEVLRKDNVLHVYLELKLIRKPCPKCNYNEVLIKEYKKVTINHCILNNQQCLIHYRKRRFKCKLCQSTFAEDNLLVIKQSRQSTYTIMRVLKELRNPRMTFKDVANQNHMSITSVVNLFDRYVDYPRLPLTKVICIDEVYVLKVPQHKYACVLLDFSTNQIIDVLIDRKKQYLNYYFSRIPENEKLKVEYICMDMWETYRIIAKQHFKNAKVIVDSFHIVKMLNDALKSIRIRVMKQYQTGTINYYILKNFGDLLLKNRHKLSIGNKYYNIRLRRYLDSFDKIELVLGLNEELKLAYKLKEQYIKFNNTSNIYNAPQRIEQVIEQFIEADIPEYQPFIKAIKNWKQEIINSFTYIDERRISNGPIESKNSIIKLIKRNADGYVNFDRFRNRIIYCINEESALNIYKHHTSKKYKK